MNLATMAVLTLLMAAGDKAPGGDLGKLQGCWTAKVGTNHDIPLTLEVRDRSVTVDLKTPLGVTIHAEGELRIDEEASPRTLDWIKFRGGDGQDLPEILAIYELDGDTWKLGNGGPNNPRPTEFKPGDGPLADVLTLTRSKPAKSSVALDAAGR